MPIPILICRDHHQQTRKPGEEWLANSLAKCRCIQQGLVACQLLKEPECMDSSNTIRKNQETWMKSACIKCACVNGSVNCTRYEVNISYGLYEVKTYPTCERCAFLSTADSSESCAGKLKLESSLFFLGGGGGGGVG